MIKYCQTCGLFDKIHSSCPLLRMPVDPTKDFCSKHNKTVKRCEVCGVPTLQTIVVPDGDKWHELCQDCVFKISNCIFCKISNTCDFETNPSSLPKMVQQEIRQGPMISVTTVKNPERIRQTCQKGCKCYDDYFGCMREFGYCERMEHIYAEQVKRTDAKKPEASADNSELHSEVHE